jgi:hypothetical protein
MEALLGEAEGCGLAKATVTSSDDNSILSTKDAQ